MKIKPILWSSYKLADGTCQVKIRITQTIDGKTIRKYVPMDIYLTPDQFDSKSGRVKTGKHPHYADYNLRLLETTSKLEKERINGGNVMLQADEIISNKVEITNNVAEYIKHYLHISATGDRLTKRSAKQLRKISIKSITMQLKYYTRYIDSLKTVVRFEDVTDKFLNKMINYLRTEYNGTGLADNTIHRSLKSFKAVMRHAKQAGIHSNEAYENFFTSYYESDNIALTEEEIKTIMKMDLSDKPYLQTTRDRFYIAYNLLMRFGDSIQISKNDIFKQEGSWFYKVHHSKTGNNAIIPLFPDTINILERCNYFLPKISNQKANKYLKDLGEEAGIDSSYTHIEYRNNKPVKTIFRKYQMISTHTCRRSMATNLYLNGFDIKQIQLMGGWKSLGELEKYLKIDRLENALKASAHPFFK